MLGFDPQQASGALLWSQALLTWSVASYLPGNDPAGYQELESAREHRTLARWNRQVWARGIAAGAVAALLSGSSASSPAARTSLALFLLAATVMLPLVRVRLAERRSGRRQSLRGMLPSAFSAASGWPSGR